MAVRAIVVCLAWLAMETSARADEPPRFKSLRYLEDYSNLAGAEPSEPLDRIKYVPLWDDAWITFGGQHRLRYEYLDGLDPANPRSSVMFLRNLVHVDIHASPAVRLFAQVGLHRALGPAGAAPPDADNFDVQQAFAEGTTTIAGARLTLRLGRQEMPLGSTRWVSVRDGANVRQAFDLVRASAKGDGWASETFYGMVPDLQRGVLDDALDPDTQFWGTYWTLRALGDALGVELFYLGKRRPDAEYDEVSGREIRHMVGTRVFGKLASGFEYIAHGLYQTGRVARTAARAWGFAGGLWQRLPAPLDDFRAGTRWEVLSGDERRGDNELGTFHAYFPNQTFFSALPAIYPSNMDDVHPMVMWEHDDTSVQIGCNFFFRRSTDDAVYTPPGMVLVPGGTGGRFTGAQLAVSVEHRVGRHWLVAGEYAHLFAGHALRTVTHQDIDFLGTWLTLTY